MVHVFTMPDYQRGPCRGVQCDNSECCRDKMRCSRGFTCPSGKALKENAGNLFCARPSCNQSAGSVDKVTCCEDMGNCNELTCPATTTVNKFDPPLCPNNPCMEWQCCDPRATCGTYTCADPTTVKRKNSLALMCQGTVCDPISDASTCCEARASCSELTCPTTHYASADEDALCIGAECNNSSDVLTCCAPRDFCSNAGFSCTGNTGLVSNPGSVMCAESPCIESNDFDTCCEVKGSCSSMRKGSARTFCNSFDAYDCEHGIRKNSHEILCTGGS